MMLAGMLGLATAFALPPDRADLGVAYLRFERAVAASPKDADTRRRVNIAFDGLTGDFFAGRFDRALLRLAEIESELAGEGADPIATSARLFIASHRFEIEPRLAAAAEVGEIRVRALGLDGIAAPDVPAFRIVLRQGGRVVSSEARGLVGEGCVLAVDPPFAPGMVEVQMVAGRSAPVTVGRVSLLESRPEEWAASILAGIERFAGAEHPDPSILASLRARYALAFGPPDRTRSGALVMDPGELARSLVDEVALAAAGGRPYARIGDTWRIVRALGMDLPVRQFVPDAADPFALIVALHGAGGDEHMFFDGYGGGRLRKLAEESGVAVVCPPTVPFGLSPNLLAKFLEELRKDIAFDPARVLLVGHSLGGVTASRLAAQRADLVAGAACIAGFADLGARRAVAPRRVYLAELDPLFPLDTVRGQVDAARERGECIDSVVVRNEGHTLVVGEAIDQALAWLLALPARNTAVTKPTASAPRTNPMNEEVPIPAESEINPSAGPRK